MPLERKITGKVFSSMRDDPRFNSCAVEVKVSKGNTLPKSALKDHQRRALLIANTGNLYHKIEDGSFSQKPFDGFILKKTEAFLVIWYAKSRETWALPIQKVPQASISLEYSRANGLQLQLVKA